MTVDEMLERMSSAELTKWRAHLELRAMEAERDQAMSSQGMNRRGQF